ncbi:MAG: DUF4931 domain-containing protein [Candidatus Coatesbacteria bacterium]|nr:DUF4931 domain-containing protein [Candidatus Coatesbacteria bacterium]
MSELRKDPIIWRWIIIAPERGRTQLLLNSQKMPPQTPEDCPFCPGHEYMTTPEIWAYRPSSSPANTPGWDIRIIPNKFPVLRIEGDLNREADGIYDKMNAIGANEVIIETPNHEQRMWQYDIPRFVNLLRAYKNRLEDLQKDPRFRYILLFKNEGQEAGAMQAHSHTQIVATPVTPQLVREILKGARDYFIFKERCIFCDIINYEKKDGRRVIFENADFFAFCPYASRFPFETWILPKRHDPDYQSIKEGELSSLAEILQSVLLRLTKALNDPQYNLVMYTGPVRRLRGGYWQTLDMDFHWHLEINPRLTKLSGFEWGTGYYINPTAPEEAAKYLREIELG